VRTEGRREYIIYIYTQWEEGGRGGKGYQSMIKKKA
jgi:hypothetical protein